MPRECDRFVPSGAALPDASMRPVADVRYKNLLARHGVQLTIEQVIELVDERDE
jgi:hypothetical protein